MNLWLLDSDFVQIMPIDSYESFIWTDRYNTYGDFEMVAPLDSPIAQSISTNYYIWNADSEHIMVVEKIAIESNVESGTKLTVSGRSAESILDRRVIWDSTIFDETSDAQEAIKKLITDSIISPKISARKIDGFIFEDADDVDFSEMTFEAQFLGQTVYEAIVSICQLFDIGFKVSLTSSDELSFRLYIGSDRTYDQDIFVPVVFSPEYENLVNSNYVETWSDYKNVARVRGHDKDVKDSSGSVTSTETYLSSYDSASAVGLYRRETYIDATSVSWTVKDDDTSESTTLTDSEYKAQIEEKAKEALDECYVTASFEGQAETSRIFVLGRDFFIGDILQIENEYGNTMKSRVTEVVFSNDSSSGEKVYPTFTSIE